MTEVDCKTPRITLWDTEPDNGSVRIHHASNDAAWVNGRGLKMCNLGEQRSEDVGFELTHWTPLI